MKVILPAAALLSLMAFANVNDLRYTGKASDLHSGQFYYTEQHHESQRDGKPSETIINFSDSYARVIVRKRIDYSKHAIKPDFMQEDLRDGSVEGAITRDGITELQYRKTSRHDLRTRRMVIPEPAVLDGGFNNYIKMNWDALLRGEVMHFNFAIPSQLDYIAFRLSFTEKKQLDGKAAAVFRMEPDNFILRKLAAPIIVTYNLGSRRLMQYEGLSNINDPAGKSYQVKLVFPVTGP